MNRSVQWLASLSALVLSMGVQAQPPSGWHLTGSLPRSCTALRDVTIAHEGKASALLESKIETEDSFCTLMQTAGAEPFRGKRVRFLAFMRTNEVKGRAGLWFRVDGPGGTALSIDNMSDRPVAGSTDWTSFGLVLDVPADATGLAYGLLVAGGGQAWMDSASLEVVDSSVATTGTTSRPLAPSNLGFED